ncbi:MAG: hypothetical protein Kow002_17530 [Anaerolineales bacterium]
MKRHSYWIALNQFFVVLIPLASLIVFGVMGLHSRYLSDDYISTYYLHEKGFLGAQEFFWNNWTGRYSFVALLLLFETFDVPIVSILPALYILFWITSLSWAAHILIKKENLSNPMLLSFTIASAVTWASFRSLVAYPQITFWLTGIINYSTSPILLVVRQG